MQKLKCLMLKCYLLTWNASCEVNESDSSCDHVHGHDPENASGPCPAAAAHAPVSPNENVVSLQEVQSISQIPLIVTSYICAPQLNRNTRGK